MAIFEFSTTSQSFPIIMETKLCRNISDDLQSYIVQQRDVNTNPFLKTLFSKEHIFFHIFVENGHILANVGNWTSNFGSAKTPPVINFYHNSKLQVFKITPNFVKNLKFASTFHFLQIRKRSNGWIIGTFSKIRTNSQKPTLSRSALTPLMIEFYCGFKIKFFKNVEI